MTSSAASTRERAVDFMVAGSLAVFPLLPAGPTYLALNWPWALEAFLLSLLAFGLVTLGFRRRDPRRMATVSVPLVRRGYLIWLVPAAAAMVIGLLSKNTLDLVLLRVEADDLIRRLAEPMNQAADPFYSLRVGLTYLEGALAFWLCSAVLTRTTRPRRRIWAALCGCLLGLALVSVIAIAQYLTRANLLTYWVQANPLLTRSHATLDDPNALASFLVLGIGLALGVAWSTRRGWRLWSAHTLALLTVVLAGVALVTTVSRAGWAAMVIALVVFGVAIPDALFDRARRARALRILARGAAALLVAAIVLWTMALSSIPKEKPALPATPLQAVLRTIDPRASLDAVLEGRLVLWQAALQLSRQHLALGSGLGALPGFAATYPGSAGPENAHNFFLQVLAEGGLIGGTGLILWLALIVLAFRTRQRDRGRRRRRLAFGLSIGLLAFVLTWLTGHPMLTLSNQIWFACVLAVGLTAIDPSALGTHDRGGVPHVRGGRLGRVVLAAMATTTLVAVVPRAMAEARAGWTASRAAGVYAWETGAADGSSSDDTRFRWTRGRAVFREPIQGRVLSVPLNVARPDLSAHRVELVVTVGGAPIAPVSLVQGGWQTLDYDLVALLGGEFLSRSETITLTIVVSPTFVPAAAGIPGDTRELGVGVGAFRWSGPRPGAPRGPA